jgi:hypothetical protein
MMAPNKIRKMLLFTLLNSPNLLTELSVPIKMHPEQYQIFADMILIGIVTEIIPRWRKTTINHFKIRYSADSVTAH